MIIPIQITKDAIPFTEQFDLGKSLDPNVNIFTEAVFANGRQKLQPIVDGFRKIQEELNNDTKDYLFGSKPKFDPDRFTRNTSWRDLEHTVCKIFGFKHISIQFPEEEYIGNGKFSTQSLNAYTYPTWRYPIDGLITDNGFYDKTHSIELIVNIYLGIFKLCTAEEITAFFLHELGHNIDPALVDIRFVSTNTIMDYIIGSKNDTKKRIENEEYYNSLDENNNPKKNGVLSSIVSTLMTILPIRVIIKVVVSKLFSIVKRFVRPIFSSEKSLIEKIRNELKKDIDNFSHLKNTEAFADNFARMYGFGAELISLLQKCSNEDQKKDGLSEKKSFIYLEKIRQQTIAEIVCINLRGSYKTDLVRGMNLIKEYDKELADPNIPEKVKKNIKEDRDRLQKVINLFLNHNDTFNRNLNQAIYEELLIHNNIESKSK